MAGPLKSQMNIWLGTTGGSIWEVTGELGDKQKGLFKPNVQRVIDISIIKLIFRLLRVEDKEPVTNGWPN